MSDTIDYDLKTLISQYTIASILINDLDKPIIFNFKCNICNMRFYNKDHMDIHINSKHYYLDSNISKYVCIICKRRCTRKCAIVNHATTHRYIFKHKVNL